MKQLGFKRSNSGKQNGKLMGGLVSGVLTGMLTTLALTAVEAYMAQKLVIPTKLASGIAVVIWILSAFVGSYICGKKAGQGTLPSALLCGGAYGLVLLLVTGFLFKARFEGVLKGLAIILAASAAAGVLASGGKGKTGKKMRFR